MGVVVKVSGPLVVAEGLEKAKMYDVVRVGRMQLIGEIIELKGDQVSIQVYEETGGVGPGEPVVSTNEPLSVTLGPGMLEGIFDGIQRPLEKIQEQSGSFIARGIVVPSLDTEKKWHFEACVKSGDAVIPGQVVGYVQETELVRLSITVPPAAKPGKIKTIKSGSYTVTETVAVVAAADGEYPLLLAQRWPIRKKRPIAGKLAPTVPLTTGQRIIDTLFPLAKGGTACIPGPFGSGKTVVQHQLAKWADADIIVYVGCGERGNEMTDVLMEFPHLKDPKSGQPLMKRTVLIANTSNMPVAAREASVYTGITIAEYYRDMGYNVAMMADSTSRWAEALREMSGRLEEMPGEEGYPAYLGSRIAEFYERAGRVHTLSGKEGSLSVIGAVSPPGGDLSEPVTQNTLRVAKVFWGLDSALAYARHFPAINWLKSYSLYANNFNDYYKDTLGETWVALRTEAMSLLQQESDLQEMVRLVGMDALSQKEQLVLETAKSIREDFLHQVAFDDADTYTSLPKQAKMLGLILLFYAEAQKLIQRSLDLSALFKHPVRMKIARTKYVPETKLSDIDALADELTRICAAYTGE